MILSITNKQKRDINDQKYIYVSFFTKKERLPPVETPASAGDEGFSVNMN